MTTRAIVRARAGGKSYELIQALIKNPAMIAVTSTEQQADMLHRMAKQHDPEISRDRFLSVHAAMNQRTTAINRMFWRTPIAVDNAEAILGYLLGGTVEILTLTGYADPPPVNHSPDQRAEGYWNPDKGTIYEWVDFSTAHTGYVYVKTAKSKSSYIVKLSTVERKWEEFKPEGTELPARPKHTRFAPPGRTAKSCSCDGPPHAYDPDWCTTFRPTR